jgi:predicted molibdopterin-dependent oxidoreductase YjgC
MAMLRNSRGNPERQVTLTIDEQVVSGYEGQTVLDVARENGIRIPMLCYTDKLKPLGACRLCIVNVQGIDTPVTACTTQISEGMVIETHTSELEMLRRETLKLIFLRHPLNCVVCDINGECQLQDLAYEYDLSHQDLHSYEIQPIDFEDEGYVTPLIRYHPRRCILCGRCVQACTEITAVSAIDLCGRGAETRIGPLIHDSGERVECVSCGECMAICPVNALTEAVDRPKAKPWERTRVTTTCSYCGVGCQLALNVVNNQVVGVTPIEGGPNQGALCVKGRFGYDFINHKDRLTRPLIRRGDTWEETGWDEALDVVAERLSAIYAESGGDAIAGLSSARCTNEENYVFQKLFRGVLGTNNVDHCARL